MKKMLLVVLFVLLLGACDTVASAPIVVHDGGDTATAAVYTSISSKEVSPSVFEPGVFEIEILSPQDFVKIERDFVGDFTLSPETNQWSGNLFSKHAIWFACVKEAEGVYGKYFIAQIETAQSAAENPLEGMWISPEYEFWGVYINALEFNADKGTRPDPSCP